VNYSDPTGEWLALAVIGVGGFVSGGYEAGLAYSSGASLDQVVGAFGRGFVSGAVGTTVGIGTGLASKNPALSGMTGSLSANLVDQLIKNGGDINSLSAWSATKSTTLGGLLGPFVKNSPGLKTIGRKPDLFSPRDFNEYGKNSWRLVFQRMTRSLLGKFINSYIEYLSNSGVPCNESK